MTVSSATARASYAGAGSTGPFTVPFYFLASSHLLVVRTSSVGVATTLALGTDYTVTGAGNPAGGSITTTVAVVVGETLTITRNVPLTQEVDYKPNDPFPAETHESALDKLTMIAQQSADTASRALTLRPGDVDGSGAYDANLNRITDLGAPVSSTDAVRKADLDAAVVAAGNVPSPTIGQVGYTLNATGAGTFAWQAAAGLADNAVTNPKLADMATQRIKGRNTAGTGDPEDLTITQVLDWADSTRGTILSRGASAWVGIDPGTAGHVLTSNGAGADPTYQAASSGVPAGSVIWFAANAAPTGYLKANGAAVSRTTYASLFSAIGTTFGVGDGSTTFNLPDLRGEFTRGWDDGRGVDSGRVFGSAQAQDVQPHNHTATHSLTAASAGDHTHTVSGVVLGSGSLAFGASGSDTITTGTTSSAGAHTHSVTGTVTVNNSSGTETRPRNVALLACIKF